jgi:hypothetical protein
MSGSVSWIDIFDGSGSGELYHLTSEDWMLGFVEWVNFVAWAENGDLIVHYDLNGERNDGYFRVNPATGARTLIEQGAP